MREMLEKTLIRFQELERQLADPEVQTNATRMAGVAREHGGLARLAGKYRRFKQLSTEIEEARQLADSDDLELSQLAAAELRDLNSQREAIWRELLDLTIGGEDANRTRCVMEIRAGTGGDEAALFAGDLYQMYTRHSETKG